MQPANPTKQTTLSHCLHIIRKEGRKEGRTPVCGQAEGKVTLSIFIKEEMKGGRSDEEEAWRTRDDVRRGVDPSLKWKCCLAAFTKGLLRLIKFN